MQNSLKFQSAAGALDEESCLLSLESDAVYAVGAGPDGVPVSGFPVRMVLEAVRIAFQPEDGSAVPVSVEGKARLIRNAIRAAGDALLEQPEERRAGGATVAVLAFDAADPSRACVLNVGNCRCYRFRGGRLEMLTRSVSPEQTESDTPLLAAVLDAPVGMSDHVDVAEQYIEVADGDALLLAPGGVITAEVEPALARSLKKTAAAGAQASLEGMAQVLRDHHIERGAFVMLQAAAEDAAAPAPAPTADAPAPVDEPEPALVSASAPASAPVPPPAPLPEPVEPVVPPAPIPEPEPEVIAPPPRRRPVVPAAPVGADDDLPPLPAAPAEAPAPRPANPQPRIASTARPGEGRVKPAPVYRVGAAAANPPAPAAGPVSAPSAPVPEPAAAKAKPSSPLSRPTVLKPEDGAKAETSKSSVSLVFAAAAVVLLLGGVFGYRWWHARSQREGDEALEAGANAVDLVAQAKMTGRWGELDGKLSKLPALPQTDDEIYRAWLAFWRHASEPATPETSMRSHLETLDALCQQAGAPPSGGASTLSLPPRERADLYARLVYDKQQTLHAAVATMLESQNRRGDFPFADRATQQSVMAALGQFTRGRLTTRMAGIQGDFLAAHMAESRLANWVDRRETEQPLTETALRQAVGEPLGQLQTSLDRAWDGLLEVVNGMSADTAAWKRQLRSDSPLLARINRIEAVRQNVIADRRRYGDVRSWRMNGAARPLANWLLSETAAVGAALPAPPASPGPGRRR